MRTVKLTIKEMQQLARERRGKCLSHEYVNSYTKLLWECTKGHQWKARPNDIKQGQWCPECAGNKKLSLQEMQVLARERGGKCLSQEYGGAFAKLLWECAEGHQWEAIPRNIKSYVQWCPECAGNKKLSLQEMQVLARERGGECLSQEYTNNQTKLLWECTKGHQWKATPHNIKQGQWCRTCYLTRLANKRNKITNP
jgi:hypothetical protein